MSGVLGVMQSLGASRQRDGSWSIDAASLQLGSIFGGDLRGHAVCVIAAGSVTFRSPPELAACGKIRVADVVNEDVVCQAIGDALDDLRERVRADMQTLRKLGCKTSLEAPDPRARGSLTRAGRSFGVVVDGQGELVVESVDGASLPADQQAALTAPNEATPPELYELLDGVLSAQSGLEPTGIAGAAPLSHDQLRELQAALEDSMEGDPHSELDDDDDGGFGSDADSGEERTVAGASMPLPRTKGPSAAGTGFDHDAGGTLEAVTKAARTMAVPRPAGRATFGEQDEPEPATLTTKAPSFPGVAVTAPRHNALIKPPSTGARRAVADDDEEPEPTTTRIADSMPPTRGGDGSDLLDAFDDDDDDADTVTTRGATPQPKPSLVLERNRAALVDPSSKPHAATASSESRSGLSQAKGRLLEDEHDGGDEDGPRTGAGIEGADDDDAFEEGKTRALAVDAALLASLKRGDADRHLERLTKTPLAILTPSLAHSPVGGALSSHRSLSVDDGEFEGLATVAVLRPGTDTKAEPHSIAPPPAPQLAKKSVSLLDAFEDDDVEEQNALKVLEEVTPGLATADPPPGSAPGTRKPLVSPPSSPSAPSFVPSSPPSPPPSSVSLVSGPDARSKAPATDELETLEDRARALEEELASVRARIQHLRARPALARVGDSEEGAGPTEAATGLLSLPILHSIDVQEIEPPRPVHTPFTAPVPSLVASDKGLRRPDPRKTPPPTVPPLSQPRVDADDVSLAALQGALKDLGVIGEASETQVEASVLNIESADDDGDVFGSGGGDDGFDSVVDASAPPDLSVEATRIRKARPSSIVLVVDDERARDRLRSLLTERIATIIEPVDSSNVMKVRGLADFDAIVLVRPPRDDDTLRSLGRLQDLPQRPRVLVLSGDDGFDDDPFVDLRLELRQRASDVAIQMIDGLEQLGLALMPAD